MNVNVNNTAIRQIPDNIIKSNYSSNMNKDMFVNLLNNAMTEAQSIVALLGNNADNLLDINNTNSFIEKPNIELEDNEEKRNHSSYENLYGIADIFFFRPTAVIEEVPAENKTLNVNYNVMEAKLQPNDLNIITGSVLQEKQEAPLAFQSNMAEKLMSEIEVQSEPSINNDIEGAIEAQSMKTTIELSEKQKNEFAHAEMQTTDIYLAKNKITISDSSTEIKSQVLSQVKDKIIIMTGNNNEPNGIKTITMQLRPQALGKVDIKMSYENNKITVEIKALNEETQKILSSNTNELRELLSKTSQADVKIIVKPYELKHQNTPNYQDSLQGNEQNLYQNNEQNHQGRQRNKYYYDNNIKTREEDVFSELIDLNYSKIKEGIHGN